LRWHKDYAAWSHRELLYYIEELIDVFDKSNDVSAFDEAQYIIKSYNL